MASHLHGLEVYISRPRPLQIAIELSDVDCDTLKDAEDLQEYEPLIAFSSSSILQQRRNSDRRLEIDIRSYDLKVSPFFNSSWRKLRAQNCRTTRTSLPWSLSLDCLTLNFL